MTKEIEECCLCRGTEEGDVIHADCHCRGSIGATHEQCLRNAMRCMSDMYGKCPTCKMFILNTNGQYKSVRWWSILSLHLATTSLMGGVAYEALEKTTRASHAANLIGISVALAVPNMYWTAHSILDAFEKIAIRGTGMRTLALFLGAVTFTYHVSLFSIWPNLILGVLSSARTSADRDWAIHAPIRLRA